MEGRREGGKTTPATVGHQAGVIKVLCMHIARHRHTEEQLIVIVVVIIDLTSIGSGGGELTGGAFLFAGGPCVVASCGDCKCKLGILPMKTGPFEQADDGV